MTDIRGYRQERIKRARGCDKHGVVCVQFITALYSVNSNIESSKKKNKIFSFQIVTMLIPKQHFYYYYFLTLTEITKYEL